MESAEVKIARLEEAMVTVKGDTKYIRGKLDRLLWSVALISGSGSIIITLGMTFLAKLVVR